MPLYEHVYLARQDLCAQQVEELTAKLTAVIGEAGGKVSKNEYWGLKSLSYRIRKNRKAHITLLNVDASSAALNEVERQERLQRGCAALPDHPRRGAGGRPLRDDAQIGSRP